MKHREIGQILGIPLSEHDEIHGGHRAVADMVKRGRKLFISNLGKEGYRKHLETIRADLQRRHSLNDRERLIQRLIEIRAGLTGCSLGEVGAMRPDFEQLLDEHFPEG